MQAGRCRLLVNRCIPSVVQGQSLLCGVSAAVTNLRSCVFSHLERSLCTGFRFIVSDVFSLFDPF